MFIGFVLLIVVVEIGYKNSSQSKSNRTSILITELQYLNDIPEIDWYEFGGNVAYIEFNEIPNDLNIILNAAASHGNNAINFGVHSKPKGWRPGTGPYILPSYSKIW